MTVRGKCRLGLSIALAGAALTAGCGGGDDNGSREGAGGDERPPGVSLSRAEFVKRAAAGCREARKGLEQKVARFLNLQEREKPRGVLYASLARLVLLPAIEAEMESIRVLGVPQSESERIDPILDKAEFTINELVYEERIASIEAVYRRFANVSRMFHEYGLPECVNGSAVTGRAA